eukprot:712317-Prymnesium_polylepis.1
MLGRGHAILGKRHAIRAQTGIEPYDLSIATPLDLTVERRHCAQNCVRPVCDISSGEQLQPLFVVAGACPNSFCGMQASHPRVTPCDPMRPHVISTRQPSAACRRATPTRQLFFTLAPPRPTPQPNRTAGPHSLTPQPDPTA